MGLAEWDGVWHSADMREYKGINLSLVSPDMYVAWWQQPEAFSSGGGAQGLTVGVNPARAVMRYLQCPRRHQRYSYAVNNEIACFQAKKRLLDQSAEVRSLAVGVIARFRYAIGAIAEKYCVLFWQLAGASTTKSE